MSAIVKEMAEHLLKMPHGGVSPEAMEVAMFLANIAWNECVGLDVPREGIPELVAQIEADHPDLWNEFKSRDLDASIAALRSYKASRFPHDNRRILSCRFADDKLRVQWLPPAAPGADSKSEMQVCGLVCMGQLDAAVDFLRDQGIPKSDAKRRVALIAAQLR